jgi:phospholipid/cholesterol/gamma-HCH transport system substrate-binding protein
MEESRLELRVGALIVVAVALLAGLLWLLVRPGPRQPFRFAVSLAYSGGISAGAPVKLAGVPVGRVSSLQLEPGARDREGAPLPVRLLVEVEQRAGKALRTDAEAFVGTQGPLGEPYLEVTVGSAQGNLREGAELRGVDPPRIDLLVARLYSVLEEGARLLVEDKELFRRFLRAGTGLAETADVVLRGRREELGAAVGNLAAASGDLRLVAKGAAQFWQAGSAQAAVAESRALLAELRTELPPVLQAVRAHLPPLLADLRATTAELAAAKVGKQDVEKVRALMARYDALGGQLQTLVTELDAAMQHVQAGRGTIGGLYRDPKVYEDMRALLDDLKRHPWKVFWKD